MIDLWVIQTGLGKLSEIASILTALQEVGCDYHLVSYPDIPTGYPIGKKVMFYGSTNFVTHCERFVPHTPAFINYETNFEYSKSIDKYQELMLNKDAEIAPMFHIAAWGRQAEEKYFFRPNKDSKAFAGCVSTYGEFRDWVNTLMEHPSEIDTNSYAVMAPVKVLEKEWRCFMIAGKYISGSQYRTFGVTDFDETVPGYVIDFCEIAARVWIPAMVFVMDVAYYNGKLFIIELNGFNSSGFYKADIKKIVKSLVALS